MGIVLPLHLYLSYRALILFGGLVPIFLVRRGCPDIFKPLCQPGIYPVQACQTLCRVNQDHIHAGFVPGHQLVKLLQDGLRHIAGTLNYQILACKLI